MAVNRPSASVTSTTALPWPPDGSTATSASATAAVSPAPPRVALPLDCTEFAQWLKLSVMHCRHRRTAMLALQHTETIGRLFALSERTLLQQFGPSFAAALKAPLDTDLQAALARARQWQTADPSRRHLLTLADPAYPPGLLNAPDPPLLLYAEGRVDLLHRPMIAIVGSRKPSRQGIENAAYFSDALARAGWTVVSGLATGIDAAAHRAALDSGSQAATLAVIGTGIDVVYPRQHHALSEAISAAGTRLSEWPAGTPPRSANFPQRNRLIAGLAQGVLVVEAALRSGSLITARIANDLGRDIFAIPGPLHFPHVRGCHALIKSGAKLIETVDDILDELPVPPPFVPCLDDADADATATAMATALATPPRAGSSAAPSSRRSPIDPAAFTAPLDACVLSALGMAPATADMIANAAGQDVAAVVAALMRLEIDGRVESRGGRYAPIVDAAAAGRPMRDSE